MTPETLRHALIMLGAGIGIPLLAALNAQLGGRIGSPPAAAVVLFLVALATAFVVMLATGGPGPLGHVQAQPKRLLLAGVLVAFYVLSITWIAPRFGVGNAVFVVLLGQMLSAAVIDHFGLFGAIPRPVGAMRLGGIGLMAAGLLLILRS
ncbi:DMT family transporter [Plastorhodobacter daqingensis]|uniref:DMT family transporter n=1 Tax=Plastorhodobacter daqingensis TaxID=1387281 RepID=A0ABW2UKT0_9RHOB